MEPADVTVFCQLLSGLVETTTGLRAALRADAQRSEGAAPGRGAAVQAQLSTAVVRLGEVETILAGADPTPRGDPPPPERGPDDELGLLAAGIRHGVDGLTSAAARIAPGI